jgi:L-aminopeptidase/D-esterase-like protein
MQGLRVGHSTREQEGTGVTAFVFATPAVGAYHLCGSSPAAHELNTMDLDVHVSHINGLVFAGGSAYGLNVAAGAMRWFQEHHIGWKMPHGVVPIVPVVAVYDLGVKEPQAPTPQDAYYACANAIENNVATGCIGAGTGASVGKAVPSAARMSGGIGFATLQIDKLIVCAYALVNSVGDVLDEKGKIIAGARLADGQFANCQKTILSSAYEKEMSASNSTLVAVFTNAAFSKAQLKRIAKMATAGMARAVSPIFTQYDGDIIFCVSVGQETALEIVAGTAAAQVVQQAIISAVKNSVVLSKGK